MTAPLRLPFALAALLLFCGCDGNTSGGGSPPVLVVYTSVDEPYARPILLEFTNRTGITVVIRTDTEATKSAGLAERVLAERDNPQADVWWGNEVFHTIRLADAGVLEPYESPAAKDVQAKFKDAGHRWAGVGLRARVIAIHDSAKEKGEVSLQTLLKPEHKGRVGIARPTAGTTGGHVSALYVVWGRERFTDCFTKLRGNGVKLLGGNGPVAEAVGRGDLALGLTDNDDVANVRRGGGKLASAAPDQDSFGTLAIPTTVALVARKSGTNPKSEHAKKLVDYLLSPDVEQKLIAAEFAGWSVRDGSSSSSFRSMDVDYAQVAGALPEAVKLAMTILEERQ